jgi:cytochrome c-type biogenesis protein CcmH/NrfF
MPKRKKKKKRPAAQPKARPAGWQPSYWMIVALVAIFFAGGVMLKAIFSPAPRISTSAPNYQPATEANSELAGQVRLVAANFRCACGQCGELFLIDCTCDMSRGAKEEKDFIRRKLQQGMSIDEVITLVEKEYGHRIS